MILVKIPRFHDAARAGKLPTMRTAAYARYSSDAQREASIDDQLRNVRQYCEKMGWPLPVVFEDRAISGARGDRPGYQQLLAALDFDVLLVDDLTRLSRDHVEVARVVRLLRYRGIRLIGVSDGVDTDRKGHKIEVGLRGLMGELYLDDLADKTHRGLMGQALLGYSAGGLPYGFQSVQDGERGYQRVIHPVHAETVLFIFQRFADGWPLRRISLELNARQVPSPRGGTWTHSALYGDARGLGILNNRLYIGQQVWNRSKWVKDPSGRRKRIERPESEWVITDHPDLRIVPDILWKAVRERLRSAKRRGGGRSPRYLFSGLLRCGVCGAGFVIVDRYRYGCSHHKDRGTCTNYLKVARTVIERCLLSEIKTGMLSEEAFHAFERSLRQALKEGRPDPDAARQAVRGASDEVNNLMQALRQGIITPGVRAALEAAEARLSQAEANLKEIQNYQPTQVVPRAREIWRGMVDTLEDFEDVDAAREAVRSLTGEIRIVPRAHGLVAEMNADLASMCQITMVAGAGFERYLTAHPRIIELVSPKY